MRKIYFFMTLFLPLFSFSQVPATPDFCKVTVVNDTPVLFWKYQDTANIDGFIVKRVIWDGTGVVNGTLNNIAIIPKTETSFKDTSTAYQTSTNPDVRREIYGLSAYRTSNDSVYYSNITPLQNTVFLQSNWDFCSQTATFVWSSYTNRTVAGYKLLYSTDGQNFSVLDSFSSDTSYQTQNLQKNITYYFRVIALLNAENSCSYDTSVSNTVQIHTSAVVKPEKFTIQYITIDSNNLTNIKLLAEPLTGIKKIQLLKNDSLLYETENVSQNIFIDTSNFLHPENYKFIAIDSCGDTAKISNTLANICLKIDENEQNFIISFNPTLINKQTPDYFRLLYSFDNEGFNDLEIASNSITLTKSEFYAKTLPREDLKKIRFKILEAKDSIDVFSNTVIVPSYAYIVAPNSFFPSGSNSQDRFFSIKAHFIDDFQIIIYNENNQAVFVSDDKNFVWDGKYNGKDMPEGFYYYTIKYHTNNGEIKFYNGGVYLIR